MNKKQELAQKAESNVVQHPTVSQPDRLLELAISQGADMAQLEKFMDLKERYDANEARKAFTMALAAFKSEGVHIGKDKEVSYSGTFYTHASLGNIIDKATPILSKHGFSHRWETNQSDAGIIKVSCILTHESGHSESTSLQSAPDVSGKKNPIQAIASAITYLERYTFLAITGLAVQDMAEDDGQYACLELISEDQVITLGDLIDEVKADKANFLKYLKVESLDELPTSKYDAAVKALESKREKK